MKRSWIFALSLGLAVVGFAADEAAFAKKPPAEASAEDKYAVPVMKETKVPEFDAFFGTVKAPIESLIATRKSIDTAQSNFALSLGLATDMKFKDAVADFQKKAAGKLKLGAKTGKFPKLEATEALPADLQKSLDAFNTAIDEFEKAFTTVEGIKAQLMTIVTDAQALPGKAPEAIKTAGLSMPDGIAATKNIAGNVKVLGAVKDESVALVDSLTTLVTDLASLFPA